MNSGKTFCQSSINAVKKRRCCHKCCEWTGMHIAWISLAVQIFIYLFIIIICTLLLVRSWHFLASSLKFRATVEVSHKAAGDRSSSKITDSYVASFPCLPHIITFSIHSWHFRDHQCFFRTSIEV